MRKSGALTDATRAWESARELRLDDPELTRHLADARWEQQSVHEADGLYREAWNLASEGDDIAALRLAEIALAEHRVEEAVEWARRLYRKPGAHAAWSEHVTNLFLRFERPAEGIAFFHQRIGVSEDGRATDTYLSRLYAKSGQLARRVSDLGAAVRHYRHALVWNPTNRAALRDLGSELLC